VTGVQTCALPILLLNSCLSVCAQCTLYRRVRSRHVTLSERNRPEEEGLQTATIGSTRAPYHAEEAAYDSLFTTVARSTDGMPCCRRVRRANNV